jgi:hypothetical protein
MVKLAFISIPNPSVPHEKSKAKFFLTSSFVSFFGVLTFAGLFIIAMIIHARKAIFHHEPCPLHESQNKSSLCQQKSPGLLLSTEAKAYDAHEQRLVINAGEAEIIQKIFNRYIETNSLKAIFDELNTQGHKTKSFVSKRKKVHQGREFSKNTVYNILKNPVYVGQIKHKEEIYQGKHQAIISQELWDRVQNQMRDKTQKSREFAPQEIQAF